MDIDMRIINYLKKNGITFSDVLNEFYTVEKEIIEFHIKKHRPELLDSNDELKEDSEKYEADIKSEKINARKLTMQILKKNPDICSGELEKLIPSATAATLRGYRSQFKKENENKNTDNAQPKAAKHGFSLSDLEKRAGENDNQKIKPLDAPKSQQNDMADLYKEMQNISKLLTSREPTPEPQEMNCDSDEKLRKLIDQRMNDRLNERVEQTMNRLFKIQINDHIEPLIRSIIEEVIAEKIKDLSSQIISKLIGGVMSNLDLNLTFGGKK